MFTVRREAAPEVEVVPACDVQAIAGIPEGTDDALFQSYIETASAALRNWLRLDFITTAYTMRADRWRETILTPRAWAGRAFVLPVGPLLATNFAIQYNDSGNTLQTFAATNYHLEVDSRPGVVMLASGSSWPTDLREVQAIAVSFEAGFGTSPDDVPDEIKEAIKEQAAYLYENPVGGQGGVADEQIGHASISFGGADRGAADASRGLLASVKQKVGHLRMEWA